MTLTSNLYKFYHCCMKRLTIDKAWLLNLIMVLRDEEIERSKSSDLSAKVEAVGYLRALINMLEHL